MEVFVESSLPRLPLPRCITSQPGHPQVPVGLDRKTFPGPLQTNKFYSNLVLGGQDNPAYVTPYTVSWTKGREPTCSWGLTVSNATPEQRVFGPTDGRCRHANGTASFYYSPPIVQNMVLDAAELDGRTVMTVEQPTDLSVAVSLRPGEGKQPAVQFPLVQGMGFVTGLYHGARPVLRSAMVLVSMTFYDLPDRTGTGAWQRCYTLHLNDGATWLVYARNRPGTPNLELYRDGGSGGGGGESMVLSMTRPFYGSVQVARATPGSSTGDAAQPMWPMYDSVAGVYATGVDLLGRVSLDGTKGTYGFAFAKADVCGDAAFVARTKLLHFALPHHCASFDAATAAAVQPHVQLATPVKGVARAVLADTWMLEEPALPADLGFLPWNPQTQRTVRTVPLAKASLATAVPGLPDLHATMVAAARQELSYDVEGESNLDSMYFAGKALAKYATLVLAVRALLAGEDDDATLAQAADAMLRRLQTAFTRFAENRQKHPLVYEQTWGGVVSSAAYTTGDANADFGGSYYNDHHFHYSYFVYTGAVLAHLDPAWLRAGDVGGAGGTGGTGASSGATFVEMLIRDYASPTTDRLFPAFRSFDWYHGHSWAQGVFATMDGKNQESSSEDVLSVYALRLWGLVCGDAVLAARASLMLAVQARSLQAYYYYGTGLQPLSRIPGETDGTQPPAFAGNKVAGILFENKMDHTTFFGGNPEFIHGIHMLPLLPCLPFVRPPAFVADEWADIWSNGRADAVPGGWRGVLYGNLATTDPQAALAFFGRPDFDAGWLDGGATRTWYLCYAAALLDG